MSVSHSLESSLNCKKVNRLFRDCYSVGQEPAAGNYCNLQHWNRDHPKRREKCCHSERQWAEKRLMEISNFSGHWGLQRPFFPNPEAKEELSQRVTYIFVSSILNSIGLFQLHSSSPSYRLCCPKRHRLDKGDWDTIDRWISMCEFIQNFSSVTCWRVQNRGWGVGGGVCLFSCSSIWLVFLGFIYTSGALQPVQTIYIKLLFQHLCKVYN